MKRKNQEKTSDSATNKRIKTKKFKPQPKKEKNKTFVQPPLPKSAGSVSCNWLALKRVLSKERSEDDSSSKRNNKRKKTLIEGQVANLKRPGEEIWFDDVDPEDIESATGNKLKGFKNALSAGEQQSSHTDLGLGGYEGLTKKIAIDCEFVGVGREGKANMLARISIVNSHCCTVYDKFVAPQERVTDYRTAISGVRPSDLKDAPDFKSVQKDVSNILSGRILIGHAIKNDLKVLFLDHPKNDIRDTAKYKPFHKIVKSQYPSLKKLSQEILQIKIQEGEHSSVQDAQAAMRLYILHKRQWEKQIKEKKFKRKNEIVNDNQ